MTDIATTTALGDPVPAGDRATRSSAPALVVEAVTKHFGDLAAVDDVSFVVGGDEIVALVGPSGCGKSTLLRMIAGLIPTESGRIVLEGETVDDGRVSLPPEHRHVGLVFQEHALFPHLSVERNVGFGVRSSSAERTERVCTMLELVGLDGYGDRYPHELSGGERQRVALARALAPDPALMLLDEPFASLDPNLRDQIRTDVVSILRETTTPALFVTHDQSEALAVGDRIAVMRAGRVVQLDTPEAVFHQPKSRFVAAFMGEADFVTASDGFGYSDGEPESEMGLAMVRPDDIALVVDPNGDATVVHAEFRGSSWCYTVRLASGTTVRAVRTHIARIEVGTTVTVGLVPGHDPVPIPNE